MDDDTRRTVNPREFSTPFFLSSAPFFCLYLFFAAGMIMDRIPSGGRTLIFPESGYFYVVDGTLLFAALMTVSFMGSLVLVLHLRGRALPVYAALPLCSITGFIAVMYTLLTFYEPSVPGLRPLALTMIGGILGFALLPAGTAYFLDFWSRTCPVTKRDLQILKGIGILGLLFFAGIIADAILDTPTSSSPYHDNFLNFTPAGAVLTLFGLLFGAVLLPVAGLVILRYGMKYRSIPAGTD